jgi:hypothetical protein
MGMKKKSDEEMYESATVIYKKDGSTSSSQVTSPLPSPHKSSASSDRSDDTDSTWVRGSVPHPDRPRTLRTLKKSQVRIEPPFQDVCIYCRMCTMFTCPQAPQNIAAEKRMAQQLRELKKLTAQQNKEQEALQARHRSEREVLASKYDSKAKARDKQNKAQEKDLINDHHEERVKLEKQHREDQKLMQKQVMLRARARALFYCCFLELQSGADARGSTGMSSRRGSPRSRTSSLSSSPSSRSSSRTRRPSRSRRSRTTRQIPQRGSSSRFSGGIC